MPRSKFGQCQIELAGFHFGRVFLIQIPIGHDLGVAELATTSSSAVNTAVPMSGADRTNPTFSAAGFPGSGPDPIRLIF